MTEECALCPSSLGYQNYSESEPTQEERHKLFHELCPTCSPAKAQNQSMCDFCQHLRLEHLIKCLKPEIRMPFAFPLQNGLANASIVTECPLCRIVNHMLMVGLSRDQLAQIRGTNHDIILYLGSAQDPRIGGVGTVSADIYASYPEGDGFSYIWVGDLHIDDITKGEACHFILYVRKRFAKKTKRLLCRLLEE